MEECIRDSKEKGKKGLVILSSNKKRGYLSDPRFMKYKGFETVDTAAPYFELMCLSFEKDTEKPCFKASVKEAGQGSHLPDGFTLYYTSQCPFTAKYIPLYADMAKNRNVNLQSIHIDTRGQAQNAPIPFTTFSLFYNGEFITHEIQSEKKFEKLLSEKGF